MTSHGDYDNLPGRAAAIRDELTRALDVLDPAPPPFASLLARGSARRRRRRIATRFSVVALPAAVAAIVIAAVAVAPSSNDQVRAASPTRQSLVRFAKAHGGHVIGGPFTGRTASYGAFSTKRGIVVADDTGSHWQQDGAAITSIVPSGGVEKIAHGPALTATEATPAIWVKIEGGDVSYFGVVLHRLAGHWRLARFSGCGHHNLCPAGGNEESYGHPAGGRDFVSEQNNCTPNCAAGTEFRIHWRWRAGHGRFEPTSTRRLKH